MSDDPNLTVRASDAERDSVMDHLSEHAAQGRLTLAELEERIERAHVARTTAELQSLTNDLPVGPARPVRRKATRFLVAVMGGFRKAGRWRAAPKVNAVAVMGGGDIDLRGAELDGEQVTLTAVAVMGGFDIYVPDSVDVEVVGFSLMGGHDQRGSRRPPRPGAPLVRVRVFALMGGVDVWRVPAELDAASLKALKKAAKQLER
ncbi:DUF1707 and DUF2154 domain-containing protein [Nonomuraea sp. K274]|uniref:DUF1707 and DUF2154 domain-containing protein n=1 Tax=Nonomuraea cypriaca TaxID=1187855 RepID=A0A931AFM8_9ACTN|nr:DUF1707 domain-containing protein [Nonomuraea cypriaca]MBF8190194.1 DUF1707 and DUF2154 domain-containing protein [Nonomuraea cypriaca]